MPWGEAEEQFAQAAIERQRGSPVPQHLQDEFNADPAAQWDRFYARNKGPRTSFEHCDVL